MAKPLLFLDVDGVLNCLGAPEGTCDRFWEDPRIPVSVCVPHGTRERLATVLECYQPVWATAWMGKAHRTFRDHLALPERSWPYVSFFTDKLPHLVKYAGGRPWAWVDDDAEWELNRLGDWWREIPDSLIVIPDPDVGLTDEHVTRLVEFAQQIAE